MAVSTLRISSSILPVAATKPWPESLQMQPEDIIEEVRKSGLRGRGGAGFPTGAKVGGLPQLARQD